MKTGMFIGIDFGTTNTAVSVLSRDPKYGDRSASLGEDGKPFPSIIAIPDKGNEWLFGQSAKKRRLELSQTHKIFSSMKSHLETNEIFEARGLRYSTTQLVERFLKYIKEYVKAAHKVDVSEAVFAFPVDFSSEGRKNLKKAAEDAGIKVNAFVCESTAAYIANRKDGRPYSRVMVIDWGGGTLDISILDLKGNKVYETAVWGEKIGGDNIDLELAERLHGKIVSESKKNSKQNSYPSFGDMYSVQRDAMIVACEDLKINFSYNDTCPFILRNYGELGTVASEIDYSFFEGIVRPVIEKRALKTIETALNRARIGKEGIDAVIAVGGSCALRPFERAITRLFGGNKIIRPDNFQWSIAEGAALVGVMDGDFGLNDDLCVLLSDNTVHPIFKKDKSKIGSSTREEFSLIEDTQNAHFIFCDGDGKRYGAKSVKTKGFLGERLLLEGRIRSDQIAEIHISNDAIGPKYNERAEINKLTFYYDMAGLPDEESETSTREKMWKTSRRPSPLVKPYDARDSGDII